MEIVIEVPNEIITPVDHPILDIPRKPIPACLYSQPRYDPIETPICDTMTWDSSMSLEFVRARWPTRNIRYIQVGRAFAPIQEMPIA